MRICVLGLWHLGSVTAACLASLGHRVVGLDFDAARIANLNQGIAPVLEPGLEDLIGRGLASGNLRFASTVGDPTTDVEVLWVACDTPVDDDDDADTESVMRQIERVLPAMSADVMVLISSQLPVGSVRRLERSAAVNFPARPLRVAYCPENLRLGKAVSDFLHPDRIVVGVRSEVDRECLHGLLSPITQSIVWMSVESAEMTKHAINAFLAVSVVFANEIAALCESVGADAKDVERGLKTDRRIGPGAYLAPGGAFAGGTLARDIRFLDRTSREHGTSAPMLSAVLPSNDAHKRWVQKKLRMLCPDLAHTTVAVWGLTYKAGTDTLRRSASIELCDWMIREGVTIHVHDPAVKNLPERWGAAVRRYDDPVAAVDGAHALVMATEWPEYRAIGAEQLLRRTEHLVVLDANRFLPHLAAAGDCLTYFAVGMPGKVP